MHHTAMGLALALGERRFLGQPPGSGGAETESLCNPWGVELESLGTRQGRCTVWVHAAAWLQSARGLMRASLSEADCGRRLRTVGGSGQEGSAR